MTNSRLPLGIGSLVGAVLILVGSVLPWATVTTAFGTLDRAGTTGDGVITLVASLAVAGLIVAAMVGYHRALPWVAAGVSGLAALVAVLDLVDVQSRVANANAAGGGFVSASVGMGLWVTLVGAVGAGVCAVLMAADVQMGPGAVDPSRMAVPAPVAPAYWPPPETPSR